MVALIDDEGRLFGRVNVIDALVVLLVLSVAVAGLALLDPFASPPEQETVTRYATIDLGSQPPIVAEQLDTGDRITPDGAGNATITDIYVGPTKSDDVSAIVRLRLNGSLKNESGSTKAFVYNGKDLTPGTVLSLTPETAAVNGTVKQLGATGKTLDTTTTSAVFERTVSSTVANAIDVEDTYHVAGQSVATVQSVDVYPTGQDEKRRVRLGLDIQTIERDSGQFFGTHRLTLGSTIPFDTGEYQLSGPIVDLPSDSSTGHLETRTITVAIETVSPEFADGIEVGMAESTSDQTIAKIVEKDVEPASVILTSDQGEIFERTHPRKVDVTLTVDVQVHETASGYQFHARSLREGNSIILDFRTLTVRGTVTNIQPAS